MSQQKKKNAVTLAKYYGGQKMCRPMKGRNKKKYYTSTKTPFFLGELQMRAREKRRLKPNNIWRILFYSGLFHRRQRIFNWRRFLRVLYHRKKVSSVLLMAGSREHLILFKISFLCHRNLRYITLPLNLLFNVINTVDNNL